MSYRWTTRRWSRPRCPAGNCELSARSPAAIPPTSILISTSTAGNRCDRPPALAARSSARRSASSRRDLYCGGFYGQAARGEPWPEGISRAGLLRLLDQPRPASGCLVTELSSVIPGWMTSLATMYRRERRLEVEVLCDAGVAAAARRLGIGLISSLTRP